MFGLPAAPLRVVNTLAHAASPWQANDEEVADTEIVHALAPEAAIREVLVPSSDAASPGAESRGCPGRLAARPHAGWRGLAQCRRGRAVLHLGCGSRVATRCLQAAQSEHVTVVVSSGDSGAATDPCPGAGTAAAPVKGVNLPASDPLALAVGGTSLQASPTTGAYIGETAWNIPAGRVEPGSLRRRLQPTVPPARLPGWHRQYRGHPGRARRGRRR